MQKSKHQKVDYRTREDRLKRSEPAWERRHNAPKTSKRFIAQAVNKPGRARAFLERHYGLKAFDEKGRIRMEYLDKGIDYAKGKGEVSLERALILAKRLKEYNSK